MHGPLTPEFWNDRYAADAFAYGLAPNAFLVSQLGRMKPGGRVLVPGDGEGRNGVWLAGRGFQVTSVDLSEVGCVKARGLAAERSVSLDVVCSDLSLWEWPGDGFDAVVSIFLHVSPEFRPVLHRRMRESLRPGGVILIEAFGPGHLAMRAANPNVGGPGVEEMLYSQATLAADFAPLRAVLSEQLETDLAEGSFHSGRAAVVRGVFA